MSLPFSARAIGLLLAGTLAGSCPAQSPAPTIGPEDSFTLSLPVDGVSLVFHVSDAKGAPIQNLTQQAIELFDNGSRQTRIVDFEAYQDLPVRAGILMDTSISMEGSVRRNVKIASEYLFRFSKRETDRAFVMRFDGETHLERDWTANPSILADPLGAAT
jgi:Ca-activated chloride channel family protein